MNVSHDSLKNGSYPGHVHSHDIIVFYIGVLHTPTDHLVLINAASCSSGIAEIPYNTELAPKLKELLESGFQISYCFDSDHHGVCYVLTRAH